MDFLSMFIIVTCSAILVLLAAIALNETLANSRSRFGESYSILWAESLKDLSRTLTIREPSLLSTKVSYLRDEWLSVRFMSLEDKVLLLRAGHSPKEAHRALRKFGREALAAQVYLRTGIQQVNT